MKQLLQIALLGVALVCSTASGLSSQRRNDTPALKSRAGFDMACQQQLDITKLSKTTYGVRGCGRQATYVWACSGPANDYRCEWLLNGGPYTIEATSPPPAQPGTVSAAPASPEPAPVAPVPAPVEGTP